MIKEITNGHRPGGRRGHLEHVRQQNHYPLTLPSPPAYRQAGEGRGSYEDKRTNERTTKG
jgi:hypothetical protein